MAFICEICKLPQPDRTKLHKVITKIRKVRYPLVKERNGNFRVPEGFEIAKELNSCPTCANREYPIAVVSL